jgi:aryl-alcohol dehydrogenase-like predicted oxidoreductase
MIPWCRSRGVGVMAFGTLAHGMLSGEWTIKTRFPVDDWRADGQIFGLPLLTPENFGPNLAVMERLRTFALEKGVTLPKLAIAWALRGDIDVALVGAVTPTEIEDDADGAALTLTPQDIERIDEILSDAAGTSPDAPEYQGD